MSWLFALTGLALAAPEATVVDVGRARGEPVLVVRTPGYAPSAYTRLLDALELAGLDAHRVDLPLDTEDLVGSLREALGPWLDGSRGSPPRLVAHGLGGRLLVEALAELPAPRAVALLGVPLALLPSGLTDDLLGRELPAGGLDLGLPAARAWTWEDHSGLPLLLGEPLPPLERVSAAWLQRLQDELAGSDPLEISALSASCPVWVGVGDLDNLAPPEAVRPHLGQAAFVRFGPLRLDGQSFDSADLLGHERPVRVLARWLRSPGTPSESP